jgi:hypothetical protein
LRQVFAALYAQFPERFHPGDEIPLAGGQAISGPVPGFGTLLQPGADFFKCSNKPDEFILKIPRMFGKAKLLWACSSCCHMWLILITMSLAGFRQMVKYRPLPGS